MLEVPSEPVEPVELGALSEGLGGRHNVLWVLLDRVGRLALFFVVGLVFARKYGPYQFGAFSFGVALITLVGPAAGLGIDQIVVRELVDDRPAAGRTVVTAALMRFCGSLVAIPLGIGLAALVGPSGHDTVAITAVLAVPLVFQTFDPLDFYFQSYGTAGIGAKGRVVGGVIGTTIRLLLLARHESVVIISATYVIDAVIPALYLGYRYSRSHGKLARVSRSMAARLTRDGWPLLLSAFSVVLYLRVDQVMVASISGERQAGVYAAAVRISEMSYFVPSALTVIVAPVLMHARGRNKDYDSVRAALFRSFGAGGAVVAIVTALLATPAIRVIYGSAYQHAALMLELQCWAAIFVYLGVVQSLCNIAERRPRLSLVTVAIGAAVNVALNLVLIPHYNGVGASIATLVAYSTASTFAYWFIPGNRNVPQHQLVETVRGLLRPITTVEALREIVRRKAHLQEDPAPS